MTRNLTKWIALIAGTIIIQFMACDRAHSPKLELTNLAHLNHLYEEIEIDGRAMAIIHIYSEHPDYEWVDAAGEGVACIDDASRAAVVYLRHFEITGDSASLRRGKRLIEFCRYLQDDDGLFYNFIHADHTINREGQTSRKSLSWWTGRAVFALGEAYRVLRDIEPDYAEALQIDLRKTFSHIDTLLAHYPKIDTFDGFAAPRWLLYNSAADATTELMLGLSSYARASVDSMVINYLKKFAAGLIAMQLGNEHEFPFGAFLSWKNVWHGWGNGQTQALASLGKLSGFGAELTAAKMEARNFYPHWSSIGGIREIQFGKLRDSLIVAQVDTFDQIAYALRPMVVGAIRLAEATGDDYYAELAADLATWFFGNNPAHVEMYDPKTGRCYDGILSATEINRNAGAESTIEALYAILEVEANVVAKRRLMSWIEARHY